MGDKTTRLIKAARIQNGYNQKELAKVMKCSQASISNWENDIESAPFGIVIRLCALLRINVAELIETRK